MRIDVISRSPHEAQAALKAGLPKTYIVISGSRAGELAEPANLIREAARVITVGNAVGRKPAVTALKASGLLFAASLSARALRGWSSSGGYDPRADLLKLQTLARTKLGPVRGPNHAVTQCRAGVADTIRILGAPAA